MSKKPKKQEVLPTEHDPSWREHAGAAGWTPADISTLNSVIQISRDDERVVQVKTYVITILSVGTMEFSGIGKNGPNTSTVPHQRYWAWRRFPMPSSIVGGDLGEPHADEEMKIVAFDLCACDVQRRKKHHPSCELAAVMQIAAPAAAVAELPAPVTHEKNQKTKKQKQHKGPNPNQLPMFGASK